MSNHNSREILIGGDPVSREKFDKVYPPKCFGSSPNISFDSKSVEIKEERMKIKLVGGPKDGEVIICPDDTLILVFSSRSASGKLQDFSDRLKNHDKYYINHGVGTYQEKCGEEE